tara:strand:- start:1089 stop:2612 length:1524 start_codon:yes stop_codon:yes gene_type:complete
MSSNYDGLTRNVWPGTWSTGTNSPIVLDTEIRGTLHSITGDSGDRLTDIPGARIQEGMLVYVKTTYTSGSTTYTGDNYYTYKLQGSESRNSSTGAVPNADANWSLFSVSGGSGYTGSAGAIGFTGSKGDVGFTGSKGDDGATGFTGSKGDAGSAGAVGFTGSKGDAGSAGATGFTGSKGDQGVIGFSGSKGDTGAAGADGSDGAVGFTGSKGDLGYSGSKGDIGFSGSKGDTGAAGADGSDGATGFTGSKGDLGYTGSIGYSGSKGDQGVIGYTGSKGDLGYSGSKGDTGFSGSKGDQGVIGYTGSEGNLDVSVSSTPPGSAGLGDVWIDDATGIQYFYMNDGNSNQWVELSNQGVVGFTGSAGASTLSALTDTTISTPQKGHTLVYNGSGWVQTQTPISQFVVTANGSSAYRFDGAGFPSGTSGDNPTIYLKKGQTYYFRNTSGGHPFRIQSTTGTSGTVYNTGVTDNNASGPNGVVVFHVPMDAPATLYYQCSSHGSMVGTITIV